jgi:hypothetical protein
MPPPTHNSYDQVLYLNRAGTDPDRAAALAILVWLDPPPLAGTMCVPLPGLRSTPLRPTRCGRRFRKQKFSTIPAHKCGAIISRPGS